MQLNLKWNEDSIQSWSAYVVPIWASSAGGCIWTTQLHNLTRMWRSEWNRHCGLLDDKSFSSLTSGHIHWFRRICNSFIKRLWIDVNMNGHKIKKWRKKKLIENCEAGESLCIHRNLCVAVCASKRMWYETKKKRSAEIRHGWMLQWPRSSSTLLPSTTAICGKVLQQAADDCGFSHSPV